MIKGDRVDYLGGATFLTDEDSGEHWGVTMGNYINVNVPYSMTESFEYYVTEYDPMLMHEYGHTIDSKRKGLSYLFTVGIPSILTAASEIKVNKGNDYLHHYMPYETRANRLARDYFAKHYGVNWSHDYRGYYIGTIEDNFPLSSIFTL